VTAIENNLDGVPGPAAGHSVLQRLTAIDADRFASDYWGRQALLTPAADLTAPFADLLDSDTVDELVSERGLRTPFLRVAKNGSTLADRAFTAPGGVGAGIADQVSDDKLVRLFADGSTLVLQGLHRVWPPIISLCQQLAAELGHPVQANAYVTPPQNQGFSDHYDVHDVFVLQIEGEKRWRIHAPVYEAPLRDQPWTDRKTAVERRAAEPPLIEAVLRPGDCLYLPRGFLHAATALGGTSIHLTIGVHAWTRYALAEQLVGQVLHTLAREPEIRRSLPLGLDLTDPTALRAETERVRQLAADALAGVDADQAWLAVRQTARSSQRAAPVGPLRQLRDATAIEPGSMINLRDHLAASLDQAGGRTLLRSRADDLPIAEDEVPGVKSLLEAGAARAEDLGLDLARRLLLAGVAVLE